MGACHGFMCIAPTYRSDYCDQCLLVRNQHQASHTLEGHSREQIRMCPGCETVERRKDQIDDILG